MPSIAPAAFLGEFDAQDGPKINYAFEYFWHAQDCGQRTAPASLHLVSGVGFVGRRVAGGKLHSSLAEFMREVAARVLTSNEAHEESVLFQDPGCPAVGSTTFCLPDILARGEKRRFCLVFLHPDYETLVSHWPLVSAAACIAIGDWTQRTTARYQQEYRTFPNLERRRDEARRKPLRLVTTLLSSRRDPDQVTDDGVDDGDAPEETQLESVKHMLCFFEAALPLVFASSSLAARGDLAGQEGAQRRRHGGGPPHWELSVDARLKARLDAEMIVAEASVAKMDFDNALQVREWPPFRGNDIAVCPLVVWLSEAASNEATAKTWRAMEAMLHALFKGNQIVVCPATTIDADDAANLALALASVLPPSLSNVRLFSHDYLMPYVSRIVSLSDSFVERHDVVPFRRRSAASDSQPLTRKQFVLSELDADGVVFVSVRNGCISQIVECDRLAEAVAGLHVAVGERGSLSPTSPPASPTAATECLKEAREDGSTSTLSQRILLLVHEYVHGEHGPADTASRRLHPSDVVALRLLDAQVRQLVREYVLRGRVYVTLFQAQEQESNRWLLQDSDSFANATAAAASGFPSFSPPRTSVQVGGGRRHSRGSLLASLWRRRGGASAAPSGVASSSPAPDSRDGTGVDAILRHSSLSADANRMFPQERFVFASSTPADHSVLRFLGSASST